MKANAEPQTEKALSVMFEVGRIVRQACIVAGAGSVPLSYLETLRFVAEKKNPTMRDIAAYLHITAPSATAIIEALSHDGLIIRKEDTTDRRLVRLFISKKGRSTLSSTMKSRSTALRGIVGDLSPKDQRELIRIFSKLTSSHGAN